MSTMESLKQEVTVSGVIAEIEAILGQIQAGGRVDSEVSIIEGILEKLRLGDITPLEALEKVHCLELSRQEG